MVRQNMHIHSKYSWDCEKYGRMEIEEIARILSENGIRYGAITDHVEFDTEPLPWVLTKLKIRNLEIDRANELYQGKITLLKAVEISEPYLYKEQVEALAELGLDFIIGSIHKIDKTAVTKLERTHATNQYYREILKMIEANQIDVVGHLDYINKYYGNDYSSCYQVSDIIQAIKEHNQIIEINTSAERRCGLNVFPNLAKIATYKFSQDEVTIGTDAHQYSELLDNLEQADLITKELGLKPVIYQKRKRIIL